MSGSTDDRVDYYSDVVGEWITCLGCFATREPWDEDRDCACALGGYDAPAGEGVLDVRHAFTWVLSKTLDPMTWPMEMKANQ